MSPFSVYFPLLESSTGVTPYNYSAPNGRRYDERAKSNGPPVLENHSLKRPIPSCKVDRALLDDIEEYVASRAVEYVNADAGDTRAKHCEVTFYERGGGTTTFRGVGEVPQGKFDNSVTQISVRVKFYPSGADSSSRGSATITFDVSRWTSQVEISLEAPDARGKVIAMHEGLLQRLNSNKTWHWLFQPTVPLAIIIIFAAIYPAVLLLESMKGDGGSPKTPTGLDYLLLVPMLVGVVYVVCIWLRPFSRLDTPRNDAKDLWFRWVRGGVGALIVGTGLLSYFAKQLFV